MIRIEEIRWSARAVHQVRRIAEQIELDSPWQARRISKRLYEAPEQLRWSPTKGRIVPEFSDPALREISVYSWRLIYRLRDAHCLEVAAVVHGRRLLRSSMLGA